MKRNIFFIAATALALLGLSSCNNEIDGNVNHDELAQRDTTVRTIFSTETTPTTRATLVWHSGTTNNGAAVHWEVGDQIWVYESFTNRIGSTGSDITATKPNACFYFPWLFRADTYKVNYLGHPSNTDGKGVTIKGQQWQGYADQTDHLKYFGDCAVATATKVKTGQYLVKFTHLPAFLNILPYSTNALIRGGMVLKKVVIKSSNPLTGVFPDVGSYGLDLGHATNTGKQIEIFLNNGNGFAADNDQVNQWRNGIYCVMVPGWHDLTIEYYCTSPITSMPLKFIKIIGAQNYAPNTITNITADFSAMQFDFKYYLWDAGEGHDVFEGYAPNYWNWTTLPFAWPTASTDARINNQRRVFVADQSAKFAPNLNQAIWYAESEPYSDRDILWWHGGNQGQGGIWLKKLSVIAQQNGRSEASLAQSDRTGKDYTQAANQFTMVKRYYFATGRPADIQNYFFVPAMGRFDGIGGRGILTANYNCYWLSTTYHEFSYTGNAYTFSFTRSGLANTIEIKPESMSQNAFPVFNAQ